MWNENTYDGGRPSRMHCYCDATQRKFREWLREEIRHARQSLGRAWYRYSFADWDDVHPPHNFSGYPESLDWLEFRIDDAFRLLHWRTELFRKLDRSTGCTAHGVAGTLESLPSSTHNEWRSAAQVDTVGAHLGGVAQGQRALEAISGGGPGARPGSRGKPFWHAEAQAGPLWMQPQVIHRPREDGRIPTRKTCGCGT